MTKKFDITVLTTEETFRQEFKLLDQSLAAQNKRGKG
jgi:hypothetical protein